MITEPYNVGKVKGTNKHTTTVLLLNVCSLRAAWRKGLQDYLVTRPHDVLVLTETRLPPKGWEKIEALFKELGYRFVGKTNTPVERNMNGVLIATTINQTPIATNLEILT